MTRQEHLQWAKDRALEYLASGDRTGALSSMHSDLAKHPELANHSGLGLGAMLAMGGHMRTDADVRDWITGFN
jgi:hypothetical protein